MLVNGNRSLLKGAVFLHWWMEFWFYSLPHCEKAKMAVELGSIPRGTKGKNSLMIGRNSSKNSRITIPLSPHLFVSLSY